MITTILQAIGSRVKLSGTGVISDLYPTNSNIQLTYLSNNSVEIVIYGDAKYNTIVAIANLDINNTGVPVANQADFDTRMAVLFPNAGGGGGAVSSVNGQVGAVILTWQDTLSVAGGSTLTQDNTIDGGGFALEISDCLTVELTTQDASVISQGNNLGTYILSPNAINITSQDRINSSSINGQFLTDGLNGAAVTLDEFGFNVNVSYPSFSVTTLSGGGTSLTDTDGSFISLGNNNVMALVTSQAIGTSSGAGQGFFDSDGSFLKIGNGQKAELYSPSETYVRGGFSFLDMTLSSGIFMFDAGGGSSLTINSNASLQSSGTMVIDSQTGTTLNDQDGSTVSFGNNNPFLLSSSNAIVLNSTDGTAINDADGSTLQIGNGGGVSATSTGQVLFNSALGNDTTFNSGNDLVLIANGIVQSNSQTGTNLVDADGSTVSFGGGVDMLLSSSTNIVLAPVGTIEANALLDINNGFAVPAGVAAPATTVVVLPTSIYGTTGALLAMPNKWVDIIVGGVHLKIPAYL